MVAAIDLNLYPFHVTDQDYTPASFTTKTAVTEVQSSLYDDDGEDDNVDGDDEYSFEKEVDDANTNIEMNSSLSNENKKLKKQLSIVIDKCNSLETQVTKLIMQANKESSSIGSINPKKRKYFNDDDHHSAPVQQSSWKRQAELPAAISSGIRRVYVHTDPSDKTLVVKDEYQWRKYGQKVTRDNPSPRAYYKCSYAPSCPVKKKVQRSLDNDSIVVATYEGEHNHRSAKEEAAYALAHECGISPATQDQRRTFDQSPKFDDVLVEQMAKYLSANANFTSDLAAAIYSKLLDVDLHNLC